MKDNKKIKENNDPCDLIRQLLKIEGAYNYSGDHSFQVKIPLKNGSFLRVGITDKDVGSGKLWHDFYKGLKILDKNGNIIYL